MKKFVFLVTILSITIQCQEKAKEPTLTHWLHGTYQSDSNEGEVIESWKHPKKEYWIAQQKVHQNNSIIDEQELEIKIVDEVLSLLLTYEGQTYTLPSTKVDMNGFEFERETEEDGPHRVKFEKTGSDTFRRVHYVYVDGRNRINMFDFSKIGD